MSNIVRIFPHNDKWKQNFEEEASKLIRILGHNLLDIHHIGSTAIPNILAKPIIDILPVVKSLSEVDLLKDDFINQGYLFKGEFGIANRRYIVRLMPNGLEHYVHAHIFQVGELEIARHLFFRDFLINNPNVAKAYEELKLNLKNKYEFDKKKYQAGKSEFCEDVLRRGMDDVILLSKKKPLIS